jgi:Prokaryotic homologs of the JAB domain
VVFTVLPELAREKAHRTAEIVRFIGMWHTHPSGLPLPSDVDLRGIEQLVQTTQSTFRKSLMMIVAFRKHAGFPAAAYIFSARDFNQIQNGGLTRSASITVLPRTK